MDLTQILKDCPSGTKLYSPMFGEVTFVGINNIGRDPIIVQDRMKGHRVFTIEGKYFDYEDAECMLFPSKDCRDWSKFKSPKPEYKFKSFEKVLIRDTDDEPWKAAFFDFNSGGDFPYFVIGIENIAYKYCIPYEGNEHLHLTTDKPKRE